MFIKKITNNVIMCVKEIYVKCITPKFFTPTPLIRMTNNMIQLNVIINNFSELLIKPLKLNAFQVFIYTYICIKDINNKNL